MERIMKTLKVIAVTAAHIFVEKDGKWWQRVRDLQTPPNITACDCCIPAKFLPLPQNDGTNPPTQEEWESAKIIADGEWEKMEKNKEENIASKRKQEEKRMLLLRQEEHRAASLIKQLRYGDAKEHCHIYGLDYETIVRQVVF